MDALENTAPDHPLDVLITRIRNARAVLVAMMNTWNDDLSETTLPVGWIHGGLEAVKELLDEASNAEKRLSAAPMKMGTKGLIAARGPDPVMAAIEQMTAAMEENDRLAELEQTGATEEERQMQSEMLSHAGDRWMAQLKVLVSTVPTTPAGLAAQAAMLEFMETEWGDVGEIVTDQGWVTFCQTVRIAALNFDNDAR
jgi:hypothetical protein